MDGSLADSPAITALAKGGSHESGFRTSDQGTTPAITRVLVCFFLGVLLLRLVAGAQIISDSRVAGHAGAFRERIGDIRMPFVSNAGQSDPAVAFYARTFAGTVFVTRRGEIVYSLPRAVRDAGATQKPRGPALEADAAGWSLSETPVAGKGRVTPGQRAPALVSYFTGSDPARWRTGVRTYETVVLGEVWPGVSLSLRASGNNVEKVFTIRPGADFSRIRMRVAGTRSLRIDDDGALIAATGLGEVTFTRPLGYQERDGARLPVKVGYRAQGRQYGFSIGEHDPALPVVIDPLLQATYLGGSGMEGQYSVALAIHPTTAKCSSLGTRSPPTFLELPEGHSRRAEAVSTVLRAPGRCSHHAEPGDLFRRQLLRPRL